MAKCAGECKTQFTKILGTGSQTDGKIVIELPPAAATWTKEQKEGAIKKYKDEVAEWAKPVQLEPKCRVDCTCNAKEPTEKEWEKEAEETREFIVHVPI